MNFIGIRGEIGFLLAIPVCLIESLSNMVLHGKLFSWMTNKDYGEVADIELSIQNPNEG